MKNKEITALIISAALATVPMADCVGQSPETVGSVKITRTSQSEEAKIDDSGNDMKQAESHTVIMGTTDTGEPYSTVDNKGNWARAEADLWAGIETCTGWTIEMKQVSDMASLLRELNTGRADAIASCFAITKACLKIYIVSDPIYTDAQIATVQSDSEYQILDDLCGHTIGVIVGQAAQTIVENMTPDYDWKTVAYEDLNVGFQDCSPGCIDCYVSMAANTEKAEKTQNLGFRMLDQKLFGNNVGWWFVNIEEGIGLRNEVNMVSEEMHEDGTVSEIIMRWFHEDLPQFISDERLAATH